VKRRWDDDVIFKNQARGTEQKGKKEFVNVSERPLPYMATDYGVRNPDKGLGSATI
jgi:Cwf15/Cwc15 cell cycle control protein